MTPEELGQAQELARSLCAGRPGPDRMTPALYAVVDLGSTLARRRQDEGYIKTLRAAARLIEASYWLSLVGVQRRAWKVTNEDLDVLRRRRPWESATPPSRRGRSQLQPLADILPHSRPA